MCVLSIFDDGIVERGWQTFTIPFIIRFVYNYFMYYNASVLCEDGGRYGTFLFRQSGRIVLL